MINLLILGGSGFIGTAIVKELINDDVKIFLVDRKESNFLPEKVNLLKKDINELGAEDFIFDQIYDAVIYLAADIQTSTSNSRLTPHVYDSILSLANFLEIYSKKFGDNVNHTLFVLASSRAVYGQGQWTFSQKALIENFGKLHSKSEILKNFKPHESDSTLPNPCNFYGTVKLTQEKMLTFWADKFNVPYNILRLQNVIGPNQDRLNSYSGVVTHFCRNALQGEPLELFERGNIVRDFVDVRDVAKSFIYALNHRSSSGIFDIGSGIPTGLIELVENLDKVRHVRWELSNKFNLGDVKCAYANIEKTVKILKWSPKFSLSESLGNIMKELSI